jgi:hypothetical protein
MVLLKEMERRNEQENSNTPSPGGQVNGLRQPHGGGRGETVTYVNEGS